MKSIFACIDRLTARLNQSLMIKNIRYIRQDLPNAHLPEFNDAAFLPLTEALMFDRDDDTLWVRCEIEHRKDFLGIPTSGDRMRLMSVFQAPIEVYLNGKLIMKEETWSDFRTPEVVLYDDFAPEGVDLLAVRVKTSRSSYCKGQFFIDVFLEKLDDIRVDLLDIKAQLQYLELIGVASEEIEKIVDLLAPLQEVENGTRSGSEITAILAAARQAGEHLRPLTKQNTVYMVGHAHIDMNWLWTMDETKDLIRRDFTTVCNMMEEYPEFRFSHSQCATYDICEREFPEVFERVSEKIKSGQWDVTATSWVENDNNMASGEAAVRQILYSKNHLQDRFGIEPDIMWAPDTFGHSANTPQVLRHGGISNYFFMRCGQKDCKSTTDEYGYGMRVSDYPVVRWEGIDGSQVIAANLEYNGEYQPHAILRNIRDNLQYGIHNILGIYGVGDHGGAPTRRDIARLLRLAKSPLFADLRLSTSKEYFAAVSKEIDKIPVQKGEKNFVFEGCYTTHGDLKKAMRKLEQTLLDTEQIALHGVLRDIPYPAEAIRTAWKTLLFHQFHDIFDGCAIAETYREAIPKMEQQISLLEQIRQEIAEKLAADEGYSVVNTTPYRRDILVKLPLSEPVAVSDAQGNPCETQQGTDGVYTLVKGVEPFSVSPLNLQPAAPQTDVDGVRQDPQFYYFENAYYLAKVAKASGAIVCFYDKTAARWLCNDGVESWRTERGILNLFAVYQEYPEYMSAWTIGREKRVDYLTTGAKSFVKESGPLVQIVTFRHHYHNSDILQDIIFEKNSPIIRFETTVEWRETGKRDISTPALRVLFEPQVTNTNVQNEIPFGVLERPNLRAEYPNLRFSAVSDHRGGLAVLNDCKYGIRCGGNTLEPTLIRSGWDPDPNADICTHRFTYGMFAFAGELSETSVGGDAAACNGTLSWVKGKVSASLPLAFSCPPNVFVSGVKLSEDQTAIILRLYEAFGKETAFSLPSVDKAIYEVDLLERKITPKTDKTVRLKPFEIKTYRIER